MLLRNDDISADTNLEHLKKFCAVFDKFGLCQTHAVVLRGRTNTTAKNKQGEAVPDANFKAAGRLTNKQIRRMHPNFVMDDNPKLVAFLNDRWQDEIALHGVYHEDYTRMKDPSKEIALGLARLAKLFPKKKVRVFVPPFNRVNDKIRAACDQYNLALSADEGVQLETQLNKGLQLDLLNTYRYHHHRFAPDSVYAPKSLTYANLENCFRGSVAVDLNIPGIGPAEVRVVCDKHNCSEWFWTNYTPRKGVCYMLGLLANSASKDALKILDLGPGLNLNLARLRCLGFKNLSGIELSPAHIAGGKEIFDAPVVQGDITRLKSKQLKGNNVILTFTVIPGMENFSYPKFIRTMAKALKPGGLLMMDSVWPEIRLDDYKARISAVALKAFADNYFECLFALHEENHVNRDWWVFRRR